MIPLRGVCKSVEQVAPLIERIFKDIEENKELTHFEVSEQMDKGRAGAVLDALILQPNFAGLGIDINHIIKFFRGDREPRS